MIVAFRKKRVILFGICMALTGLLTGSFLQLFASRNTFLPMVGKTVIVDAGHGAPDGGAVAENGTQEKDLNLSVAQLLQQYLEASGVRVIVTRADDNGIYSKEGTIRQKKQSDLKNREMMMEESDADLFVSIHMNRFPDGSQSGPQVFYSKNHTESKTAASCVQTALNEAVQPQKKRMEKQADANIYLLKQAKIPAILAECGFLSNRKELLNLETESYREKIARAIFVGIVRYFETINKTEK